MAKKKKTEALNPDEFYWDYQIPESETKREGYKFLKKENGLFYYKKVAI